MTHIHNALDLIQNPAVGLEDCGEILVLVKYDNG